MADISIPSAEILEKMFNSGQIPTQAEFLDYLESLGNNSVGNIQAVLLLVCGLVYLLYGWKIFKVLVVVNAAILGTLVGTKAGAMLQGENMPLFGGIAGAVLLAVLAWPLMKYAVSLMGGLAGSFFGYGSWHYIANAMQAKDASQYAWVGALIGLIVLGMLAFIIFRVTIVLFTSIQGSFLTVAGSLALLMLAGSLKTPLRNALEGNLHLLPILIVVPAVIGVCFQHTITDKKKPKADKKPAPAAG